MVGAAFAGCVLLYSSLCLWLLPVGCGLLRLVLWAVVAMVGAVELLEISQLSLSS
jgi:hypothetical protein